MKNQDYYKPQYKTAEHRAFYLTAIKGYGSFTDMASAFGVSKAYLTQCCRIGVPPKYAGFLGRKFKFHPAVLSYEQYVTLSTKPAPFDTLTKANKFFDDDDIQYILEGSYIKDAAKFLRQRDCIFIKGK